MVKKLIGLILASLILSSSGFCYTEETSTTTPTSDTAPIQNEWTPTGT